MWEELDEEIKLCIDCNPSKSKIEHLLGEGNREAKVVVIFDNITESMINSKSILKSEEVKFLDLILNFSNIKKEQCYYTTLVKYYNSSYTMEKERIASIPYLIKELTLINPEYIIVIGENLFDFLFKYYTNSNEKVDVVKNVGKIFNFYGTMMIPIYDLAYIKNLKPKDKKKMVDILKEINK